MRKHTLCIVALLTVAAGGQHRTTPVREPLRLDDGTPIVAAYFFTHWWEPWKSDDDAILKDLAALRDMGVNTLLLDHEASQACDGDFKYLDRDHRLAKQAGMRILPWLSLKTWSDMTNKDRRGWSHERYGAAVDVTDSGFLPYGTGTLAFGVNYAKDYLARYREDGALLHVERDGERRPVVALAVEAAWQLSSSLDVETRLHFCRWLRAKYTSIDKLNAAWQTDFSDFYDVDPSDSGVFDYEAAYETRDVSPPVLDHVAFRAGIVSDALALQRSMLRQAQPNLLIAAEIPYHFGDEHPHAWRYTLNCASVSRMVDYADIVFLRSSGVLSPNARKAVGDYIDRTGKKVVMTYRISPMQGPGDPAVADGEAAALWAREAAAYSNGLGYYSWNEMVDVHIAMHTHESVPEDTFVHISAAEFERLCARVAAINQEYLGIYKSRLQEVAVPPSPIQDQGLRVLD